MKKIAWLVLSFGALAGALAACSSDPEPVDPGGEGGGTRDAGFTRDGSTYDSSPSPDSGLGELRFQPEITYSGFDGTHTFLVPIAVYDSADDLEVAAADPSAVTITPKKLSNPVNQDGIVDNGKYYFVTVKKAGTLTLTARSGGKTAQATINVADYAPSRWAAGETRYENDGSNGEPACSNCHVNGQAIDHSPASMAGASDAKLATVITTGISTVGFPIQGEPNKQHRWDVTTEELDGLVTYLRGLEPRGFQ